MKLDCPQHWKLVTHSEIAEINPKLPANGLGDNLEVSFVPMKSVEERTNTVHLVESRRIGTVRKGYTPFIDGDVILAKITPCLENGKCAVLHGLKNGIGFGSTEFHVSRPSKGVLAEFLFHFFNQEGFRRYARNNMTGSVGQKRVPTQFFRDLNIPLPPMEEQERIVAKIEELFSELDAGVEGLKKAQAQLKTYRQSVLKHAFEGRLTNDNIKDGQLPDGWSEFLTKQIAEVRLGRQRSPKNATGDFLCRYIRAANITWSGINLEDVKVMNFSPREQSVYRLQEGDVLLNEASGSVSEVGKSAIWYGEIEGCCFQNTVIRVRPGERVGSKFLQLRFYYDAISENFRSIARGVGIHHLGAEALSNWKILVPSLDEQQRIVAEIESRLSVCDKMEEAIRAGLKQSEALRQSILKKAFEGRLV